MAPIMSAMTLTPDEMAMVAHHAISRRYRKMCGDRGDRAQLKQSTLTNEIEGALAEYWYSRVSGQPWSGSLGIHAIDAGIDDVRWTQRDDGNLLIYPRDIEERRYVLIGGYFPDYYIVGWQYGKEAKQPRWFIDKWGLYRYPRNLLRSAEELAA